MQNSFDTSFIPQQPLLRVEGVERRREPVNLALILSFILFFVSLITAGGIYFYQLQVDKRIQLRGEELAALEKTLEVDEIEKYKLVAERITTGRALLSDHGVFSVVLDFLEETVAKNVGLTSLDYQVNVSNQVEIHLSGDAPSFQAAYFQSETWKKSAPFIQSIDISSVSLDDTTGIVSFNAGIVLNSASLKYSKFLETQRTMSSSTSDVITGLNTQTP